MSANTSVRETRKNPYEKNGNPIEDIGFGPDNDDREAVGRPSPSYTVVRKRFEERQVKHAT